jgi:cytochrome P450
MGATSAPTTSSATSNVADATGQSAPAAGAETAPDLFLDPYALYAALRESDTPVQLLPVGAWAVTRYDDVLRILRDPALSVEEANSTLQFDPPPEIQERLAGREGGMGQRAMLNLDPPDHHRLRRLVSKVFTPKAIAEMRPAVERLVDDALASVEANGEMDVISDLAFPLPFAVISDMMGIPEGRDRNELRTWSSAVVKTLDPVLTVEEWIAALDGGENMEAYLQEAIAYRRANPDDKLLSGLIAAEEDGETLSPEELIAQVILLYVAGHETTVNLIGNGTLALLRHRDQLERLRDDPELDANAVEELLRYDSPVQMSRRITLEPLTMHDVEIDAGGVLMTLLGSANRDPRQWGPTADDVDLGREGAVHHVSFGGGVHHCLGAFLARLEGQVAIPTLVRRFPSLELAVDEPQWNGRIVLRGLTTLPVAWTGGAAPSHGSVR